MNLQDLFYWGMKRELPDLVEPDWERPVLNLGAGRYKEPSGCVILDWPEWNAEHYQLPFANESVGGIFAFHFLEHLTDPRRMIMECQRVLEPLAPLTIVVPHAQSTIALHDLDHKAFFVLDTWRNLFDADYDKGREGWNFNIGVNITMAITERNTAILTQLIKRA